MTRRARASTKFDVVVALPIKLPSTFRRRSSRPSSDDSSPADSAGASQQRAAQRVDVAVLAAACSGYSGPRSADDGRMALSWRWPMASCRACPPDRATPCSSSRCAVSAWPFSQAAYSGVAPSFSALSTAAPLSSNSRATSRWRLYVPAPARCEPRSDPHRPQHWTSAPLSARAPPRRRGRSGGSYRAVFRPSHRLIDRELIVYWRTPFGVPFSHAINSGVLPS